LIFSVIFFWFFHYAVQNTKAGFAKGKDGRHS